MKEEIIELPYLHRDAVRTTYVTGLSEVSGLSDYVGVNIRNRVVCRVDIIAGMTDCFEAENLEKFRNLVFGILSGKICDSAKVSQIFTTLYLNDKTFRKLVGSVYYFGDLTSQSYYMAIMKELLASYRAKEGKLDRHFANYSLKLLFYANGYAYIAVKDLEGSVCMLEGFKEEVISRAKVWESDFKFI